MYYNRFKRRDFNIENLSTKLLKFKESVISCSILSTSKEESLDSVIVDLKLFFTIFSLENECSTEHVVTVVSNTAYIVQLHWDMQCASFVGTIVVVFH